MAGANPPWTAAVAGSQANAGLINQFLGSHSVSYIASGGAIQAQAATGTGVYQSTATQWYDQLFTTGSTQTTIGSVNLQLSTVGGSPTLQLIPPITISLFADSFGQPTGSALVSTTLTDMYVYTQPFWASIPLPTTVFPSANYHIVVQMVGNATNYYALQQSNQTFGVNTSPDGATWSAQAYGLMYQVLDGTGTGPVVYMYEDGGAKITQISYNSLRQPTSIIENINGQTTAGNLLSTRNLTYTNGILTGVS